MSVSTEHRDGAIFRTVTIGAETYEFVVVDTDESDLDSYEYQGDGEAPDEAVDALQEWIDEYHDVQEDA